MLNETMLGLGTKRSVIRELFEYGKQRIAAIGAENVYDFSLGNPSVEPPITVKEAIEELLQSGDQTLLHGYTSAQGDVEVRKAMAAYLNKTHGEEFTADQLYMTCGAAASLMIALKAMMCSGDEIIIFAPFFPEYRVFVESAGGKCVVIPVADESFQLPIAQFEKAITPQTKGVIVNSPNNPSGVVYSEDTIIALTDILKKKEAEYGHPIYLIADEPYRELVYDGIFVPFLTKYYDDTLVCYSFSKSLSLPGERIGYIALSPRMNEERSVYAAICGAGRALGFVCAPSMFQKVAAKCVGQTADVSIYQENRNLLADNLSQMGYTCVSPDGAFYLFVKALEEDATAFCEKAKSYELLLVPGDDFGCPGYVRIAYCVSPDMIRRSLPAFAKLAKDYLG